MNAFTLQQRRNTRNEPHDPTGLTAEVKVGLWRLREGPDGALLFERRHGTGLLYHAVDSVPPEPPAPPTLEDRVAALESQLGAVQAENALLRESLELFGLWRSTLTDNGPSS